MSNVDYYWGIVLRGPYSSFAMLRHKPLAVVNTRTAVRCVIFPINALEERKPEQLMSEVLAVKPIKRRLPGTGLLIKLGKDREKLKEKKADAKRAQMLIGVDEAEVAAAMDRIVADLA